MILQALLPIYNRRGKMMMMMVSMVMMLMLLILVEESFETIDDIVSPFANVRHER